MADSFASSYLPALSRLFGEVEQPTQNQGMMSPQFGGSPEQLMGILQHPQTQQLMSQLGIHFDPSQIRQSPFLPQSFMQGHPQLGGALSGAMANVAATPEAPMVSGAGSGMTRAMQGMMGGPELQRQYQVRQMLAPMQAMGSMMPAQEFQRKQQLLTLLQQMEQDRSQQGRSALDLKRQEDEQKQRYEMERINATRPVFDPLGGSSYTYQGAQPQQPPQQGPMQGLPGAQGSNIPGAQGGGAMPSMIAPMAPGIPAQPGGWQRQETPTSRIAGVAGAKETAAQKKQREGAGAQSQAGARLKDRTDPNRPRGGGAGKDYSKDYQAVEDKALAPIQALERQIQDPKSTPKQKKLYQQQIDTLVQKREQEKATIDQQRGDPGASKRQYNPSDLPKTVSPGAGAMSKPAPAPSGNFNPKEVNRHPEMQGQPPGYYNDNSTQPPKQFYWDGKQVGQGPQQQRQQAPR